MSFRNAPESRLGWRFPREGKIWLVLAAVLWVVGLSKGINLLTVLASFLLAIGGLNFLAARRQLLQVNIRRWVERPAFALTPLQVEVEATNPGKRPRHGLRMEDQGDSHRVVWFVPRLAARETLRRRYEVVPARRGWYSGGEVRLTSGFPFGLVERSRVVADAEPILVYPKLGRLHRGRFRRLLAAAGPLATEFRRELVRHPAAQTEFHGLRTFRPGDSYRLIHWRTSARRGELMVREFEDLPTDDLVVLVDPWLPAQPLQLPAEYRPLEEVLSLASTICWEWCRHKGNRLALGVAGNGSSVVLSGTTGKELAGLFLECLALERGSANPDVVGLVGRLAESELPAGPVVVVSSRAGELAGAVQGRLNRRTVLLDVSDPNEWDFYERAHDE